ncbi:putative lactam utilization protein [Diplodia seriata]|uniref:Putative lactam utilization protein n=1 Tax=Diplodia seriata TaxID=420778 RepID=A0A0G2ET76_9PEZI|nr:putative lactam utilization protein [Diplodia seriata]
MAPSKHRIKINVDLGEGYGNFKCGPDEELIPLIDHANVACGFHAGDPLIMSATVRLCAQHRIAIGAHPGLPDIQGFGRREMSLTPAELTAMTRPWTPEETRKHVTEQVYEGAVTAVTGEKIDLPLGDHEVSLCCHSDSPGCMEIVKAARAIVDEFNAKTFP